VAWAKESLAEYLTFLYERSASEMLPFTPVSLVIDPENECLEHGAHGSDETR
jgi:hypothetical protein